MADQQQPPRPADDRPEHAQEAPHQADNTPNFVFDRHAYGPAAGRPATDRAPRVAGPQRHHKKPWVEIHGIQVGIQPPDNAWVAPKVVGNFDQAFLDGLAPLPETAAERALMWCHNCYRQHDPALCVGPSKDGTIDICPIDGRRHLPEDCIYYTFERFMKYGWYYRQARPPTRTRLSLNDIRVADLPPGRQNLLVAPVQRASFASNVERDNMQHCMRRADSYPWKTHAYHQEELPHLEARKAIDRSRRGGDAETKTLIRYDPGAARDVGPPRSLALKLGQAASDPRTHRNKHQVHMAEHGLIFPWDRQQAALPRPALDGMRAVPGPVPSHIVYEAPAITGLLAPRPAHIRAAQLEVLDDLLLVKSWEELGKFRDSFH